MCFDTRREHDDFHYATDAELDRAGAMQEGANRTDRAWILSDRDVWYKNPFYIGPPVKHPEDDGDGDDGETENLLPYSDEDMPF